MAIKRTFKWDIAHFLWNLFLWDFLVVLPDSFRYLTQVNSDAVWIVFWCGKASKLRERRSSKLLFLGLLGLVKVLRPKHRQRLPATGSREQDFSCWAMFIQDRSYYGGG